MYGPGGMSDEVLVFKPDRSGFAAFSNPLTDFAHLFRWSIESVDRLKLDGYKHLCVSPNYPLCVVSGPPLLGGIFQVTIQAEATPSGWTMPVLRFFNPQWGGVSDEFGLVHRDVNNQEKPDFSWIKNWPT